MREGGEERVNLERKREIRDMRGRSYSPSPPPRYSRRGGRSPSPRGRYPPRGSRDLPTSLLVRNLRHDCRPEDLRRPFGQFGPLKDIYLPKDYYTGEPRGFGFVQYVDPADAADAKYHMDGQILLGRELTVVFAEENRKKPNEMRSRERRGRFYDRRRSPPRYSRSPRYSPSPPPRHGSRSRSRDYYSPPPKRREYSRSVSPEGRRRYSRERSYSQHSRERSFSRSPPYNGGSRSRSQSPAMGPGPGRSRSPSSNRGDARESARARSPSQ
ncbi:serine/arginine-rich SC35-like splicing factor SCL30A [Abrus precatorius]|uniref:Serine/arginine-rich SC35-like splicing factor SCL30A n=1 Tax=Abrus precatorius TaxID=3816 RepID=A0A8B8JWJ2_ABRPR|nr:serine/arginine-rich SC35-like splicing factor SCL30A [Abrus precatorius]